MAEIDFTSEELEVIGDALLECANRRGINPHRRAALLDLHQSVSFELAAGFAAYLDWLAERKIAAGTPAHDQLALKLFNEARIRYDLDPVSVIPESRIGEWRIRAADQIKAANALLRRRVA